MNSAPEHMTQRIAVLFARADSIYKTLTGCDVYDIERDARTWPGGCPVVAHPPCRAWGRLRHFAKPRHDERDLGLWAVDRVRKYGGVLEHPASSTLFNAMGIPKPGEKADKWGGWTLPVSQNWWGHRAEKKTWLYIVGIVPAQMPVLPLVLGEASHTISSSGRRADGSRLKARPEVTKAEREHTPPELALWLVDLASRCKADHVVFSGESSVLGYVAKYLRNEMRAAK